MLHHCIVYSTSCWLCSTVDAIVKLHLLMYDFSIVRNEDISSCSVPVIAEYPLAPPEGPTSTTNDVPSDAFKRLVWNRSQVTFTGLVQFGVLVHSLTGFLIKSSGWLAPGQENGGGDNHYKFHYVSKKSLDAFGYVIYDCTLLAHLQIHHLWLRVAWQRCLVDPVPSFVDPNLSHQIYCHNQYHLHIRYIVYQVCWLYFSHQSSRVLSMWHMWQGVTPSWTHPYTSKLSFVQVLPWLLVASGQGTLQHH